MTNLAGGISSPSGLSWTGRFQQTSIRVLTVDGDPLVREGLSAVINKETGLEVVAQAATGTQAIDYFRKYRPDVVTLGMLLSDMPGELLASRLLAEFPSARIVAITSARGDVQLLRILEAGIKGLLLKGMPHAELIDTIRQVHAGRKSIPGEVASTLAEHLGEETLTPREVQVLRLVAQGRRNKQIAVSLSIADETVRMHMKNILSKLSANDRTHAVTIALTRGMFEL